MVKIAVLAPMPSASVSSAAAVKPGVRRSMRSAVADVLPERLEERQAALIAPGLGDLRLAAEFEPRRAPRGGGIEAGGAMARLEHLAGGTAAPAARSRSRAPAAEGAAQRRRGWRQFTQRS